VRQRNSEITRHNLEGGIILERLCAAASTRRWRRRHVAALFRFAHIFLPRVRSWIGSARNLWRGCIVLQATTGPVMQFCKGERKDDVAVG
jgi:hypothetical protein